MCKVLCIKPGKALDFLNRWNMKITQSPSSDVEIIKFSTGVKSKQQDNGEKLKLKKDRAMERKKDWIEKNRDAMNSRKRELYAEKKAAKQQEMYQRFKAALTRSAQKQWEKPKASPITKMYQTGPKKIDGQDVHSEQVQFEGKMEA